MVKKISKPASPAKGGSKGRAASAASASGVGLPDLSALAAALPQVGKLAGSVKDSAQQIWLAGMGAFAKAQGEGGKVFETLVKEGLNLHHKTTGLAEEKVAEVTGRMSAMADTVADRAGQNWDKLEAIFEQRTAKALGRLGVPTAKDVAALAERVDQLAAAVDRLTGGKATSAAPKRAGKAVKAAKAANVPRAATVAKAVKSVKRLKAAPVAKAGRMPKLPRLAKASASRASVFGLSKART